MRVVVAIIVACSVVGTMEHVIHANEVRAAYEAATANSEVSNDGH